MAMEYLKNTEYVLKITGNISDSKDDQEIWDYIVNHDLQDKIEFTGFRQGESLSKLIGDATCIVCPSIWYENMPNAVIEAYAHGKPVVASRLGSLIDMVEEEKTGYLVTPRDSKELAEKLYHFCEDESLSAKLGKDARAKCEREYCEELHMNELEEVFKE